MGVPFKGKDGNAKVQFEKNADQSKCEKSPAGHYIDGVCIYLYDEEMKPMDGVEVEDLTPSGQVKVRDKETNEIGTISP